MRARKPELDFSSSLPIWAPNREFCQIFNAISVVIMELEPYMNRVMRKAKEALDEDDELRNDIDIFVRQEANHTLLHRAYNQALYDAGYDQLNQYERKLAAEYTDFLKNRPLIEQVAYCEGFESLGPIMAEIIFEQMDDLLEGGNQEVIDLWKWHLAEEYEHRNVAYDVYHRLGGSWLHRLKTTYTTLMHLGKHRNLIHTYMMEKDRESMTDEEIQQSKDSIRQLKKRLRNFLLRRAWRVLLPTYTPAKLTLPKGADKYLNA